MEKVCCVCQCMPLVSEEKTCFPFLLEKSHIWENENKCLKSEGNAVLG